LVARKAGRKQPYGRRFLNLARGNYGGRDFCGRFCTRLREWGGPARGLHCGRKARHHGQSGHTQQKTAQTQRNGNHASEYHEAGSAVKGAS
jgi:hypothetical protein